MKLFFLSVFFVFLDYSSYYWNKENRSLYLDEISVDKSESIKYVSFKSPRVYFLLFCLFVLFFSFLKLTDREILIVFMFLYSAMVIYSIGEVLWIGIFRKE
jgi:hypothetical protein